MNIIFLNEFQFYISNKYKRKEGDEIKEYRPEERKTKFGDGEEIVDIESELSNIIESGKNLENLNKTQEMIIKCLGLLA